MPLKSISFRLILSASLWIVIALVITEVGLTKMFRSHVTRVFDAVMHDHLEELLALSIADKNGLAILKRHPANPKFKKPYSGWYWQVFYDPRRDDRSRSLWDQKIALPANVTADKETSFNTIGPRSRTLRAIARSFTLPDASEPIAILVAGPAAEIDNAVNDFANTMASALIVLGLGLVAAVFVQVRFGMSPLKKMRSVLSEIRAGRRSRMEGDFASEIQPLANELNELLDHNTAVIKRARTHAGNLAHALKTPLAVITNEADRLDGETANIFQTQAALMADQIASHLSRARIAASHDILGAHCDLHEVVGKMGRVLSRVYKERNIEYLISGTEHLGFRGEQQDLEEMLGNLMDNAGKWAKTQVHVQATHMQDDGKILLSVDDDGPGIPAASMNEAMNRGKRLDETIPGSGLGLSIVCDIAEMYNGKLELQTSSLGGLGARLTLPAA